ncbi:MAG: DMT family transporter [Actinomycetota bacterium]
MAAVLILSPDALIIRSLHADPWTVLLWRGVLTATGIVALAWVIVRRGPRPFTGPAVQVTLLGAVFFSGATVAFVTSLRRTDVANVLVIVGAGPLFAAILSRVFLREDIPRRTWVASLSVVVGLAVILAGSLQHGSLVGDLIAVAGSLCFAAFLTTVRRAGEASMLPALAIAGLITACVAVVAGAGLRPPPSDVPLLLILGLVILPVSLTLTTRAARDLPAPEVSLVSRIETLLGPFWVWLAVGEIPAVEVVVGGLLIVVAASLHSLSALRAERHQARTT